MIVLPKNGIISHMNRLEIETALDREVTTKELVGVVESQGIQEITIDETKRRVIVGNWEDFIKFLIGLDLAYYPDGPQSKPQLRRPPLPVIKYDSASYGAPYSLYYQSMLIGRTPHPWEVLVGKKDRPNNQNRKIIKFPVL